MTPRDMEWQEESLDQILSETGGWKVAVSPERAQWILLYFIRLGHKGLNHFTGGTFDSALGLFGPPNFGIQHIEEMVQFRKDWEKKGALAGNWW